jgi:hypothetical protein
MPGVGKTTGSKMPRPFLGNARVCWPAEAGRCRRRRITRITGTGQTISGTSTLIKVFFGENDLRPDDGDDELTVSYWGIRPKGSES